MKKNDIATYNDGKTKFPVKILSNGTSIVDSKTQKLKTFFFVKNVENGKEFDAQDIYLFKAGQTQSEGAAKETRIEQKEIEKKSFYVKKDPIYNSTVFGVPVKYIAGAAVVFFLIKGMKK